MREKQIEEMVTTMCNVCAKQDYPKCDDRGGCFCEELAETYYNEGYRKQSEGEWKRRGNEKTCSLCKFIYYSNNDEWNFCPNCGAKMKGGEE